MPACGYPQACGQPVVTGPGSNEYSYRPNEYAGKDEMNIAIKALAEEGCVASGGAWPRTAVVQPLATHRVHTLPRG